MARVLSAALALGSLGFCLGDAVEADCKEGDGQGLAFIQAKAVAREPPAKAPVEYHWGSGRGNFPQYGVSPATFSPKLSKQIAWTWSHPMGRFATLTYGTAIDHMRNIYLSGADGVRKFDESGKQLW
ncbi:unnamed protein product, partial [Symbiodinium pilosum]